MAAGLLAVGVAAACGGGGGRGGGGSVSSVPAEGDSGTSAAATDRAAATEAAGAPLALAADPAAVRAAARDVVRTGTLTLRVEHVDGAAERVRALATAAGGFVADEDADARDHEVDLTLRVPAERFEDVRHDVAALGDVIRQRTEARDVTAQVVDVDSRVRSLRASVERVRGLLARSGDVGQLAVVEGELARREAELESLEAQQRVLKDQVTLATLRVHVGRRGRPEPVEGLPGFAEALHGGWVALVDVATVAVAAVGYALPFALPAALAALAVRTWRRRHRDAGPADAAG